MNHGWTAISLVALLLLAPSSAKATTLDAVKASYKSVTTINAKISLTKTSKYLKRPVVSEVELRVSPGLIIWESMAPVRSKIQIDHDGLTMDGTKMDGAVQEKAKPLISTLKSLLTFDWRAIEEALDVKVDGLFLRGTPKPNGALAMFSAVVFEFQGNLDPKFITLTADREITSLRFQSFDKKVVP